MKIRQKLFLAGLVLLTTGVCAEAGPVIAWNPDRIAIEQKQGTQSTLQVAFTSTRHLDGVAVRISPELLPWLSVAPGAIDTIEAGETLQLTLLVQVPSDAAASNHDGTVQLREQVGGKLRGTLARPLSVILRIIEAAGDNGLPPDPGEEGKNTLLGIDSDTDGVRDDIQRYIYFSYTDEEAVRLALTQVAMEYQGLLAKADDAEAAMEHANRMSRHGECLHYLKGRESGDIIAALKAEILNTKERSLAYIQYNKKLGGYVFRGKPLKEWRNSCCFDIDAVEGRK
ncbi:MAG: NEW3 domain-containing protein [Pseudomonadota bacterium]